MRRRKQRELHAVQEALLLRWVPKEAIRESNRELLLAVG
jgi:hypothetical protein